MNPLELFMAEEDKLMNNICLFFLKKPFSSDQKDVIHQTELAHRHSVAMINMIGDNITPSYHTDPIQELTKYREYQRQDFRYCYFQVDKESLDTQ